MTKTYLNRANVSLCLSVFALLVSVLGQYLPYYNANNRIAPFLEALDTHTFLMYASCEQKNSNADKCKVAIDLSKNTVEMLKSSIESERSYLSAKNYWKALNKLMKFELESSIASASLIDPEMGKKMREATDSIGKLNDKVQTH